MPRGRLSFRETSLLIMLFLLLAGIGYNRFFYSPLQEELQKIDAACAECDIMIAASRAKIHKMEEMQAQLEAIFADPAAQISEIAPYDNKEAVFLQLSEIFADTSSYSLNFAEPKVPDKGIVQRNISVQFRCDSYESAREVIRALAESRWRCRIGNLVMVCEGGDMMTMGISVTASLTFFEYTE